MAAPDIAKLAALAAPLAEALIRPDDRRRASVIDHVTAGGNRVVLDRTVGKLPVNQSQIVQDQTVEVTPNILSNARNLEQMLSDIVAVIDSLVWVGNRSGNDGGFARRMIFPDENIVYDEGNRVATINISKYETIPFVIDGNGSAITTGLKGFLPVDFNGTIVSATMLADQSGSAVVDIWKDTYANYPPTVVDTITASAKPTISAAVSSQDTTLTGWTTTITAGDVLGFNVDSCSTITKLTVSLKVLRT